MSWPKGTVGDSVWWWRTLSRGAVLLLAYPVWVKVSVAGLLVGLFALMFAYRTVLLEAARAALRLKLPLLQPAWRAFKEAKPLVRVGTLVWLVLAVLLVSYMAYARPRVGPPGVPPDFSELKLLDGEMLASDVDYQKAIATLQQFVEGDGRFQGSPILLSVSIHDLTRGRMESRTHTTPSDLVQLLRAYQNGGCHAIRVSIAIETVYPLRLKDGTIGTYVAAPMISNNPADAAPTGLKWRAVTRGLSRGDKGGFAGMMIEFTPDNGSFTPWALSVPLKDGGAVVAVYVAPPGSRLPSPLPLAGSGSPTKDGRRMIWMGNESVGSTASLFVCLRSMPTALYVGSAEVWYTAIPLEELRGDWKRLKEKADKH